MKRKKEENLKMFAREKETNIPLFIQLIFVQLPNSVTLPINFLPSSHFIFHLPNWSYAHLSSNLSPNEV